MPLSAAEATKRRTKSPPTGREPTRKRPRSAIASGVFVALVQRPDPLPRALDAAPDGGVEDAAARDLEVRESGFVEDLGEPEQLGGRHPPGKRLLAEQADRRVDEHGHAGSLALLRARDVAAFAGVDLDPVAHVHEQRHLHDGAGLEASPAWSRSRRCRRLTPGSVSATASSTDPGICTPAGFPSTQSICTELDGCR